MIFWAIIFGAALAFLITFSLYLSADGDGDFNTGLILGVFIIILSIAEILTIYSISEEPKPKAIDVYRGNTELEIHSINNIPQDTVVVWKNN